MFMDKLGKVTVIAGLTVGFKQFGTLAVRLN
jgi:hypothetical protein